MLSDTIYALSSGAPPAAIAIVRLSGPGAFSAAAKLSSALPRPRHAGLRTLLHPLGGEVLDQALVLTFPGPNSATGEDLVEFHLHGGRAVVRGVMGALQVLEGLREAQPGEFTRRAFENGRIDLAEAEGLADLLEAETEMQRRAALGLAGGSLSRQIEEWQQSLLVLSARVEAELDFSDEEDVESAPGALPDAELRTVREGIRRALASPPAERLRDGIRVTVAGPPNAGKSSLINYLAQREVAITSSIAGTTRDVIEAPIAIRGIPLVLADTAGLRSSQDEIEAIGIGRARQMLEAADLILWLGSPEDKPRQQRIITVHPKADLDGAASPGADVSVSATTGDGMDKLVEALVEQCKGLLPGDDDLSINTRHRQHLHECLAELDSVSSSQDPLITAEHLRRTRLSLDRITGRAGVEEMLNMLFGRFCIGK